MNKGYLRLVAVMFLLQMGQSAYSQMTRTKPDARMIPGTTTGISLSNIYTPNVFNGTANINIPIYQFSPNGADYGVSFNYNTKGVKVDMPASPVGLGWSLVAGASITRVVKDLPDEINKVGDSLLVISPAMVNHERFVKGKLATYTETAQEKTVPNTYRDGECDEFMVSLGGSSFSFYLGKDNKIITVPHRNVKIEILSNDNPVSWGVGQSLPNLQLMGFRITDEEGNKYIFSPTDGSGNNGYEINRFADWQQVGYYEYYPQVTHWSVLKVVLADGNEIDYEYGIGWSIDTYFYGYPYNQYTNYFVKESADGNPPLMNYIDQPIVAPSGGYKLLTKIKYPNGVTTDLVYDTDTGKINEYGARMLKEVRVSSGNNCIRYKLQHAKINGRLFLKKITMQSCDSSYSEPYYSFGYNPTPLPPRLSSAQDLFGYYNGDSTGTPIGYSGDRITIPRHHPDLSGSSNYGSDRAYNASFAQAGILDTIRNAYGGELTLSYGANAVPGYWINTYPYNDPDFVGINAIDGVCLQSITQKDKYHPNNTKLTTFTYSNGQLFTRGGFFHYPLHIDSITGQPDTLVFQSMFLTSHALINGCNHGYSNVSVKTYTDGALLSRRDITFTNADNPSRYYHIGKDFYEYPYTDKQYMKDWEIGLPLTITDYDQNNRIVSKTSNYYEFSDLDLSASNYISNTKTMEVNSGTQQLFPGKLIYTSWYPYKKTISDTYYPFTGTAHLDSAVTLKYVTDSRFIADTIWYKYDDHNNISATITRDSKGQKTETDFVYNYDVDGPNIANGGVPHPGTTLYDMTDSGLEKIVSTEHWQMLPPTPINPPFIMQNNNKLLDADIACFNYEDGKLWRKSLLITAIGTPVAYSDYTGIVPNGPAMSPYGKVLTAYNTSVQVPDFQKTGKVTLFDSKGNPLEMQIPDKNQFKAMIWDPYSNHKLAEVSNSRYQDVAYEGFEEPVPAMTYQDTSGNFNFFISGVTPPFTDWPSKSYEIRPPSQVLGGTIDGTQMLTAGKTYRLSLWVKNDPPHITIGSGSSITNVSLSVSDILYTKGTWKNYQVTFTPSYDGQLHIGADGSSTSYVDEIRLFPADAQMQSWTYEPLFGKSSGTDAAGRITWYEHDKLGRPSIVRDQEGNIISKTEYMIGQ